MDDYRRGAGLQHRCGDVRQRQQREDTDADRAEGYPQ
jgi:hypothetical protein